MTEQRSTQEMPHGEKEVHVLRALQEKENAASVRIKELYKRYQEAAEKTAAKDSEIRILPHGSTQYSEAYSETFLPLQEKTVEARRAFFEAAKEHISELLKQTLPIDSGEYSVNASFPIKQNASTGTYHAQPFICSGTFGKLISESLGKIQMEGLHDRFLATDNTTGYAAVTYEIKSTADGSIFTGMCFIDRSGHVLF